MSERENQLPTSTTGDDDHHETPSSSKFFQRVSNISLVDQAITTTTNSYQRVKGASPSLIQPAIESAEQTTIKLLERIISTIQALPLPLAYADNVACGGLDKLEQLTEYKECLLTRLRLIKSEKDSLGKDSDFYERLLTFANETKDLAVVEVRSTLQAFVDTQLRLLERIEDVVDSFYRTQKQRLSKTGNEDMSDVKLSTDLVQHLNHVKQVVEDVMQQRNILCWFRIGSANPLEPVWRHLHASAQALTPEIATMKNFSDKISFLKVILHSVVEQIKLAAKNPRSTFEEIKNNLVDEITGVAVAWLPEFALRGITRITGFPLLDRTVAQIEAPLGEESCQAQCSSDGMKNKADEVEEEKEEEEKTSRPIITVSEETDPEIKGPRKTEPVSLSESSIGFLEVVQEVPAEENDDSSDQHSQSGLENSTEIDVNNGDEGKKLSRSTRRRRKKFAKNHENASH